MSISKTPVRLGLALFAAALFAAPASADFECVASCQGVGEKCISGARDAFKACKQGYGCEDLRSVLMQACFGPDRDHDACREAGAEMRTCLTPCFEGLIDDAGSCRVEVDSCIARECGDDNPWQRLLERFQRYQR